MRVNADGSVVCGIDWRAALSARGVQVIAESSLGSWLKDSAHCPQLSVVANQALAFFSPGNPVTVAFCPEKAEEVSLGLIPNQLEEIGFANFTTPQS